MSTRYLPFVFIGVIALIVMIRNTIKGKFSETESLIWALAGLIMVTSPFYMDLVDRISLSIGVSYTPALIFALVFLFVFFLLYRLSAAVYRLNEKLTELVQLNAIYEQEIRKLSQGAATAEQKNKESESLQNGL